MSTINTNGINVNYPVPGKNNDSQGFRDNFASIKTNLDTAGTEITDLQNKVVVKQALANTTVNNDMGNTLISNAATRGFRGTTVNLGNALSGTVIVDVSMGDVQYGTITGNVTFQFGGWSPTGTQSNVQLQLSISNSDAVISWPAEVVSSNNNFGVTTLENYLFVANTAIVTIPNGVSQLDYRLSSTDCGNTIVIEPYNRPRKASQILVGIPATSNITCTGTITANTASSVVTGSGTSFTTELVAGRNVLTTSNVLIGTVSSIANNTSLTLVANATGNLTTNNFKAAFPSGAQGDVEGTILVDTNYMYVCTKDYTLANSSVAANAAIWKRTSLSSY